MRSFNFYKLYSLLAAKILILTSVSDSNAFSLESLKSMFFQSPLEHLFKKTGLSLNEFSSKLSISKSSLSKIFDNSKENESKLSEREHEKIKIVENQVTETIKQFSELLQKDGVPATLAKELAENGLINAIKIEKINLSSKSDLNLIKKEIEKIILDNGSFTANNFAKLSGDTISNLQKENIRLETIKAEKFVKKSLQEHNDTLIKKDSVDDAGFFDAFLNNSNVRFETQGGDTSFPFYYYAGIPFGLLALSGGGGSSSGVSQVFNAINANVIKGPVGNALVFLDYDKDGILDSNEPSTRTNNDGGFSLTPTQSNYNIIALTDAKSLDYSSGTNISGLTKEAPEGAKVITLNTTLMQKGNFSSAEIVEVLGLPDINPLTFNPYAAGVDATKALEVEKLAHKTLNAVGGFASVAEGAGASQSDAYATSLGSMVKVLNTIKGDNSKQALDLNSTADIALLKTQIATDLGSVTGVDVNAFNALATDTQTAISNVNTKVDSTTDLTSDTTKNTFSVGSALFDQLKTAGLAEKTSAGSGSANIAFKTMANVNTAALNKPPSDISLSSTSIAENASSLLVGTLTTSDTDQGSGVAFNYSLGEISGEDYGSISINQSNGQLSLSSQPDYETKTSYTFTLISKDDGGKSFSKSFTVGVDNVRDTFDEALIKTSVKYVKQDIYTDLNNLSTSLENQSKATEALIKSAYANSYVDRFIGGGGLDWGESAFNSSNTTLALTSTNFTITDQNGYSIVATFNNFNPTDLSQIQQLVNITSDNSSTWKIDGGFSSLQYNGPNGNILNYSFGDTQTVITAGENYYPAGGLNKMIIHGKLLTDTVSDLLTLAQKANAFSDSASINVNTFDSSTFYDLADYSDGKFTFSGVSIYRDGETKAAASTTFSGDEILSMSLEDYTLTLTVEDISKFQTPAKELENWQNLTQAQINTILENAYSPTNKDGNITFSHSEYGELIKIETSNLGFDLLTEKGMSNPGPGDWNKNYGINSSGEHFVRDDDYILMTKVNFGGLDASGVNTQNYFDGWNSQTLWLQQIYNDVV